VLDVGISSARLAFENCIQCPRSEQRWLCRQLIHIHLLKFIALRRSFGVFVLISWEACLWTSVFPARFNVGTRRFPAIAGLWMLTTGKYCFKE